MVLLVYICTPYDKLEKDFPIQNKRSCDGLVYAPKSREIYSQFSSKILLWKRLNFAIRIHTELLKI